MVMTKKFLTADSGIWLNRGMYRNIPWRLKYHEPISRERASLPLTGGFLRSWALLDNLVYIILGYCIEQTRRIFL